MNKMDECDIVKDLSSLYIENMLSKKSEEFINRHLKNCENCKKYYKNLNYEIFKEGKNEKENDEIEINHLRKVSKKITILKWSLTIIIIAIIVILLQFMQR